MSSSEPEMTVQVATADNEIMTITMTPTSDANSATMSSDHEGIIATTALQMVEDADIVDDHSYRTSLGAVNQDEPVAKRQRLDTTEDNEGSLKAMILAVNRSLCARLDTIESKMKQLQNFCQDLDGKVNKINATLDTMGKNRSTPTKSLYANRKPKTTVVGLPPNAVDADREDNTCDMPVVIEKKETLESATLGSNVTLITLNCEDDYPHGSWLGDSNNIQCRVRCSISPTDLLHVMETARTADKCALKLMDYLFDREVQATSNLSGTGKHGKKQLDPLMIYGIRCHLVHKFGVTDNDWHRIKLNIDSKCRTAFRRKQKGLPMKVKDFGARKSPNSGNIRLRDDSDDSMMAQTENTDGAIQIEYKLHELPDGQVTAVPSLPVLGSTDNRQRVQLSDGQEIAISESAQLQLAQMCSQGIPPGTTLVMTQSDVQDTSEGGNIVMRLTADGTCLEQVQPAAVEEYHQQEGTDSHEKTDVEGASTSEEHSAHDILVEIQTLSQSPKNT